MTTLYAGLRDTAHRLISDKGKSVTIRTITTTTPVKSYRPVEANSDETGKAIVIEYTARDVDGSTVVRRQASFPASDNHFSRSTPLA